MKCSRAERHILLEQAGELPPGTLAALNAHLTECEACHAFKIDAEKLLVAAEQSLPDGEPRADTLAAIRRAASERPTKKLLLFPLPSREVLACAAVLLFLVAAGAVYVGNLRPELSESQIAQVGTIVELLSEEEVSEEADQRQLARQLLRLQGLFVEEYPEDEELMVPEEPVPTDLQSRNTRGTHPAGCV